MTTGCDYCDWTRPHTPSGTAQAENEMYAHMRDVHPEQFRKFMDWLLS